MNPDDCKTGHAEAKSSRLAFKLRTKPVGPLALPGEPYMILGNCHACGSTIALETEPPTEETCD